MRFVFVFMLLIAAFLLGFSTGVTWATDMFMDKAVLASAVLFDIELTPKAMAMLRALPELLNRLNTDQKIKLGLTEYIEQETQSLNQSIIKAYELKYGTGLRYLNLTGGLQNGS